MYNISIEGIIEGDITTPRSNEILAHTDIDKPGSPIITNLTCMDEGKLYLEWLRPEKYGSHVDTYKIFYGPKNNPAKVQFKTVKANPEDTKSKVKYLNLSMKLNWLYFSHNYQTITNNDDLYLLVCNLQLGWRYRI